ncbi:hypothetical protein [Rivularia sp. UHCC 0363]|uniref:hypothetical protein n=1 Tax=Rivularia sp. UHCC 0363 TaxID=3110244 RepID=UPI002B1F7FF7|nr:hypothetical protein [Rivularia sp. UHCC 0363]MEA5598080.1 hypothetical protein [Rivularia sp. UHCC 0363]
MVLIKQFVSVIMLALVVSCSSNSTQKDISQNTSIIPGKQVGAVTKKTTRADLVTMFGESKLTDDVILEDKGTLSVPVTKVNLGKENNFTVVWEEDTRKSLLYVTDFGSAWKTPEGIGVGTPLKELNQKLGDFKLTGLGWDYGGFINLETTKLPQYQGKLSLRLAADEKAAKNHPKQYKAILGDIEFSSTNPNWQPLDMKLAQMTVQFDE